MPYTHTMKDNLLELELLASAIKDEPVREFCLLEVRLLAQMLGYVSMLIVSDKVLEKLQ